METDKNIQYYLLTKKDVRGGVYTDVEENKESYKLVEDFSDLTKEELLNHIKKNGFIDAILVSKDTFDLLTPLFSEDETEEVTTMLEEKISKKKTLKEIEDKTPGFKKYADEPIVTDIINFFKKTKKSTLKNIQIIGEHLTIDGVLEYSSKQENLALKRVDAQQEIYDFKADLEKALQKKYDMLPLSIQGIDVREDKIRFEMNSMLASSTRENVEMFVDSVKTTKKIIKEDDFYEPQPQQRTDKEINKEIEDEVAKIISLDEETEFIVAKNDSIEVLTKNYTNQRGEEKRITVEPDEWDISIENILRVYNDYELVWKGKTGFELRKA